MKHLLSLLLFLVPVASLAQLNYINYHKQIIQAENYMLAFDYKACVKTYKETFHAYPKTFARDAFVALQIACIIKDTASVSYFFERSVSNGLEWETLKAAKDFRDMCAYDLALKNRLDAVYANCRKNYEGSINAGVRKFVLALQRRDDSIRNSDHGKEV